MRPLAVSTAATGFIRRAESEIFWLEVYNIMVVSGRRRCSSHGAGYGRAANDSRTTIYTTTADDEQGRR